MANTPLPPAHANEQEPNPLKISEAEKSSAFLGNTGEHPDKPNFPNNDEFLKTVFHTLPAGLWPVIVSFAGNPHTVPKSAWDGRRWEQGQTIPPNHNAYFSVSAYTPTPQGSVRRKKEFFGGQYAVVLDDVGSKVDPARVTLSPSWKLETSQLNYQVGYLLKEPITDPTQADRLMKALIAAGLCDAGAGGPTARLVRLPVGINGKHTPPFQCRMESWHPEQRYSPEEIVAAYNLDLQANPSKDKKKTNPKAPAQRERDEVFQPAPGENPVVAALKARKLYKEDLGGGKHDITCPWCHEHTEAVDGGTAYFEPNANYTHGGFNCFHSHGEGLSIRHLLDFLGVSPAAARMKPSIRVVPGQLHQIVPYAEKALADTGRYFYNGASIVTPGKDPMSESTVFRSLNLQSLPVALSGVVAWERLSSGQVKEIDPPEKIVSGLLGSPEYRYLPYVLALAHHPYLRRDGTLVNRSGYDAQSYLYGAFKPEDYQIPDEPTREDAENALNRLSGLLEEFTFAAPHDASAALSAMLTAVLRPILPVAPMYHVQAPQVGSGKSFLCSLISVFATAKGGSPTSFPRDEEECQKMLLAELMRGTSVIEFDNLTSDLIPHKSLCTALTSETLMGRILGVSRTVEVGTRVLFLSSGNNVTPVRDMARRCVTITLNPQCETPAARTFKNPHVLNNLQERRAEYIADALTIVRAWICAGRPQADCKPVASYGEWAQLCRHPLLWLDLADPAQPLFNNMESDPDKENLTRLMGFWWTLFGTKPTMVRNVLHASMGMPSDEETTPEKAAAISGLRELLEEVAGEGLGHINPQRLGTWLKRRLNRIIDNKRLVKAEGHRAAAAFQLELVK